TPWAASPWQPDARAAGRRRTGFSPGLSERCSKAYATSLLDMSARWLHGFALVAALLLLDVSLTFHNVWPTPAISWRGVISIELAAYLLGSIALGWRRRMSGAALQLITAVWICL